MDRPKKRTVLILAALLLLVGVTVIVWEINDWPPVRLILKYGFPPTGGPTGNVRTIEGVEFVELKPGYVGAHVWRWSLVLGPQNRWEKLLQDLGLKGPTMPGVEYEWLTLDRTVWVQACPTLLTEFEHWMPSAESGPGTWHQDAAALKRVSASFRPCRLITEREWLFAAATLQGIRIAGRELVADEEVPLINDVSDVSCWTRRNGVLNQDASLFSGARPEDPSVRLVWILPEDE